MNDITLLLDVTGTNQGIKAVLIESGGGVAKKAIPELAIKSPAEFVKLDELKRLGSFEHPYRGPVFPGQAIQRVLEDLGGSRVSHLLFHGAESQQIEDSVPVTFYFSAYGQPQGPTDSTHL